MRTQTIDQIVNEILADMSNRKKDTAISTSTHTSATPHFEDAFEKLLQDEDPTSQEVMRRIWKKLLATDGKANQG